MQIQTILSGCRAVNFNVVSIGDVNASIVPIQNTFKAAILSNATSLMLLHNHISGVLEPSGDDMLVTKRIIEAGRIMNIPVVDHLIVAGGSGQFYSFRENYPEMFDVTVSEAVREAHSRSSVSNVAEGGNNRENSLNKAVNDRTQATDISSQGMSKQEISIREKLQGYKPLAKVEELVEENYNQIDNQLSNTTPSGDSGRKTQEGNKKRQRRAQGIRQEKLYEEEAP